MSTIKVITVTTNLQATEPLLESLRRNGWDFECIYTSEWKGFGTKILMTYNYLVEHPEIKEFIFCDAFDVVALGTPEEFLRKLPECNMMLSAEKGCWPKPELASSYFQSPTEFKYVNSGLYYARRWAFEALIYEYKPRYETDDQLLMTIAYLMGNLPGILLDNFQSLFNSHSFINEGEYGYENGRLQILDNESVFTHKNGRTEDPKLDEMLNNLSPAR